MKVFPKSACIAVFLAVASLLIGPTVTQAEDKKDESKTKEVEVKDITLKVPGAWKSEPPTSKLRLATFKLPAVKGDDEEGELAIYSFGGGGGSVEANIQRWIAQFDKEEREVKVLTGDSAQGKYILVDVQGTYNKPDGPPFLQKTIPVPNSRMLAVILAVEKKGNYFLKLTGPKKTVTEAANEFRTSFGGDAEKEEEFSQ